MLVPKAAGGGDGGGMGGSADLCIPLPQDPNPIGPEPPIPGPIFMSLGAAAAHDFSEVQTMADFSVHDITVSQQPFFNPNGSINSQHRVQFFVGSHGPFNLTFVGREWDPNKVREGIEQKVRELRLITGDYGGPAGPAA